VSAICHVWDENKMSRSLPKIPFGKQTQSAFYIHKTVKEDLPVFIQRLIEKAERKAFSQIGFYNVIKVHKYEPRISFLAYPNFDKDETPSLKRSVVVNFRTGKVAEWSYGEHSEPPILHKKQLLLQGEAMRNPTTAIARSESSMPFRVAVDKKLVSAPALDWGCGKGADVRSLRDMGIMTACYDPAYAPRLPKKKGFYSYGHAIYVVNTIEDSSERTRTLKRFRSHLKKGASWLVAVRSRSAIERAAEESGWRKHKDGYLTGSGTFQKGYSKKGLASLLAKVGFSDFDTYKQGDSIIAHTPVKKRNPRRVEVSNAQQREAGSSRSVEVEEVLPEYDWAFFSSDDDSEEEELIRNPLVLAGNPKSTKRLNCERIERFVEECVGWLIDVQGMIQDESGTDMAEVNRLVRSARDTLSSSVPDCDENLEVFHRAYHTACRKIERAIRLERGEFRGHKSFKALREISTEIHRFDKWMHELQS